MEKIVIGISDAASMKAVDWVIDRAKTRKLEVTLVAAYDWTGVPFNEVSALLRTVRARIGIASPRTSAHVITSEKGPDTALSDATEDADLLVIGSRQRDGLQALFELPALRLARHERCATVIVPDGWNPTYSRRIVVGLDDGSSAAALEFAAREVDESGARLEVVHAWTAPLPPYDPVAWVVDTEGELRAAHRLQLDSVLDHLQSEHPSGRVSGYLEECVPVTALRDRGTEADLIVIGSHRHGPIARALLGSTARGLLHDATTPICIVPTKSERARAVDPSDRLTTSSRHGPAKDAVPVR